MTLLAISLFIVFAFLPWQRRILPRLFHREYLSRRRIECLAAAVLEGASPDPSLPGILVDALKNRRQKHLDACTLADHLARTDPVTGLFKRWYLEYRAVGSGFIVLCDLLDLKTINDRDGLTAGDVLLAQIAKIAATKVRSADLVARLDGGLLAVWCPDADASRAEVVRKRLCETIAAQTRIQTRILPSPPSFEGQWWKESKVIGRSLQFPCCWAMDDLSAQFRQHLLEHGADQVGIADLGVLDPTLRKGFPIGVAILATFPPEVIARNVAGPTPEYAQARRELDQRLAELRQVAARFLITKGYRADTDLGTVDRSCFRTPLPLKTVATLSGLGWIGRSALLVSEQYGSAFRLGAILTDAPLSADEPISQSRCGSCHICVDICPAGAPLGPLWQQKMEREQFFNYAACKETAYRLTRERIVEPNDTIAHCGICLANCRFTKRWVENAGKI